MIRETSRPEQALVTQGVAEGQTGGDTGVITGAIDAGEPEYTFDFGAEAQELLVGQSVVKGNETERVIIDFEELLLLVVNKTIEDPPRLARPGRHPARGRGRA